MYGYIYETTNLINGKKYIGKHKSNKFDSKYLGSGIALSRAITKYGKENFEVKILEEIETNQDDLDLREIYYIEKYNAVKDNNYYNYSYGGKEEGWQGFNKNKTYKNEIIVKSNKTRIISEETKIKNKNSLDKYWSIKDNRIKHSQRIKEAYNKLSEKEKMDRHNKLSESHKGYIPWNKGLTKETDNRLLKQSIVQKGRQFSEETKQKMSIAHKGKHLTEEQKKKISETNMNHSVSQITKNKIRETKYKKIKYKNIIYSSVANFCKDMNIGTTTFYRKWRKEVIYLK